MVHAERPEVVAAMPELTQRQQELWERLRHEGTFVLGGRERKTIEALVRRGLATYEAEYVLNEKHSYYAYRFTVRLNLEKG
jgi:methylase of polypeptide subunit release factors